ncbi:hypothetical protein GPECTOR_513g485 [Gonium pectorale]|uniref:Uncharacterized protein n=1 Tax=Gonium pectorale TaxID=33097 RepID=A0A150FUV4_GONPE|nr:hypothetical protein GPECTOR_513g485 [Gonium pectorale]|eukprot:KXZ41376.1 hypothetical protein GPECTOR_513g485 [Gonium pectorale]
MPAARPEGASRITRKQGTDTTCEVFLIGVFHRDAANLRFVAEAVHLTSPDVIAVEARPSFLPAYRSLSAALPKPLLRKMTAETLYYISLEDRLSWHAALLGANERLAATSSSGSASSSSALSPPRLLSAFLARELVLSDKVAAVGAAGEAGLPLHGLELDDPAAYAALLAGPLTAAEGAGPGARPPAAHGRQLTGGAGGGGGGSRVLSPEDLEAEQRAAALSCLQPAAAAAFDQWFRRVARGSEDSSGSGSSDGEGDTQVLLLQLSALMAQCMDPASYMSYVDETDALMSDAGRVGAAAAAQYAQLTAVRETHFLRRLYQLAANGGGVCGLAGGDGGEVQGRRPRRLAVVLGRAHAARMRRALDTGGQLAAAAAR